MPQKLQLRRSKHPSGKVKGYVIVETAPSQRPSHVRRSATSTTPSMSSGTQYREREPAIGDPSRRDSYSTSRRHRNNDYYDGYGIDSYAQARPSRRAQDTEIKIDRLSSDPKSFDDGKDQRLRSRNCDLAISRKLLNNGIPFGKAMKKLYKQLDHAHRFYDNFKNEFENETSPIKAYAEDDILDDLWMMKVQGKASSGRRGNLASSGFREDSDEDDPSLDRPGMRFAAMRKKIIEALGTALHSDINAGGGSLKSKKAAGRHDSIVRLHGKVATANEQIKSLLYAAGDTSEDCDGLLNELQLLKNLVDPDIMKNRALYRVAGDEEDEGDEREDEAY